MKRILPLMLLCVLCMGFASCGNDDEPIVEEKFTWRGDWNDPADPAYKIEYQGKYNPIQGLWQYSDKKTNGLYFSSDFKCYNVAFAGGTYAKDFRSDYQINDKAFSLNERTRAMYRLDNGNLYYAQVIIGQPMKDAEWNKLIRMNE